MLIEDLSINVLILPTSFYATIQKTNTFLLNCHRRCNLHISLHPRDKTIMGGVAAFLFSEAEKMEEGMDYLYFLYK